MENNNAHWCLKMFGFYCFVAPMMFILDIFYDSVVPIQEQTPPYTLRAPTHSVGLTSYHW